MKDRERDAVIAVLYFDWHWVAGVGPMSAGEESDWVLPQGMHVYEVGPQDCELVAITSRGGKFTIKALPHFTTDIEDAWRLMDFFTDLDLSRDPRGWRCRIRQGLLEVSQFGDTAPLAICRAAKEAKRFQGARREG